MGLKEAGSNDGKIYLSIYEGKIKRQFPEGTENTVKRVNKNGKTVYEKYYDSIEGKIIDIQKHKHDDYGWSYVLVIWDEKEDERYHFSFPCSSRQTNGFFRRLPNIKLEHVATIVCGMYDEKPYLTVKQFGEKVEYFWTKENPGDLPDMKEVMIKGSPVWDDTDRIKYIDMYLEKIILPKLQMLYPIEHITEQQKQPKSEQPTFPGQTGASPQKNENPLDQEEDDLPF